MGPKTDRRHLQGEESRKRILDAVIQIAAERGYEGTTVALVSKRSGLPVSSIYWHFKNKDELIAAVIERSYQDWDASLTRAVDIPDGLTRRQLLAQILRHEAGSLVEHPEFLRFGLMLTLEQRAEEPKARKLFLEVRRESLDRMIEGFAMVLSSEGLPSDGFAHELATFTMASVDGLFIAAQASPMMLDLGPKLDLLAESIDLLITERARANRTDARSSSLRSTTDRSKR